MTLCGCGCGEEVKNGRKFIQYHWIRVNNPMNNPESREKVSKSRIDKPLSEETKQKMSMSHTGVKRTPHTEETKRKLSKIFTGRTKEEYEYLRISSEKMRGRTKETHEGVRRHAEKMRGRTKENNEGVKKRVETWKKNYRKENHPFYGKKFSDAHRKKISENHADFHGEKSSRYGKSSWKKGLTKEEDERVKKHADTMRRKWQDPVYVRKMLKSLSIKPNKPEKIINSLLQHLLPNEYTLNVEGHIVIDSKIPDFVNINGQKKLIEFNGDHWHNEKETEKRIELFKKYGWSTLVIWEHEMNDMVEVTNKILVFHDLPAISAAKQLNLFDLETNKI